MIFLLDNVIIGAMVWYENVPAVKLLGLYGFSLIKPYLFVLWVEYFKMELL